MTGTVDDPDVTTANLTLNSVSQIIPVVAGSFSQKVKLVADSNTITVAVTDVAGNDSSIASATVTFDKTKPLVTITTPANRLFTNVGGQMVTGNVSDPSFTNAPLY